MEFLSSWSESQWTVLQILQIASWIILDALYVNHFINRQVVKWQNIGVVPFINFYFQEAFRAFHPTTKLVSKYMPGLHIGKLASDEVVKDEDMKKDFIELRKTAEQMVCDWYGFLLA